MAPLNLPVGQTSISVRVQPVVLFSICDAYIRRNEGKERVIGTLLGSISDGVVDVRDCYAVPHNESMDQVSHTEATMSLRAVYKGLCMIIDAM